MMRRVEKIHGDTLKTSDKFTQQVQSEELRMMDDNIKRYIEAQKRLQELTKGSK